MVELIHTLEHSIGLCGEKHITMLAIIQEWSNFNLIYNYIKTWRN